MSLQPLNHPTFKFVSVSSKLDSFLEAGESYTPSQLASLPAEVRSDHQTIISVLRQAISLNEEDRKTFLEGQDLARQAQIEDFSLDTLLSHLAIVAKTPLFSSRPIAAVRPVLARVGRLRSQDTERVIILMETLMDQTTSVEEGVEVATWILRVGWVDGGQIRVEDRQSLIYETIQELLHLVRRLQPRQNPGPLLHFLLSNQPQIRPSFKPENHPLVALLEEYSRLYTTERKVLNPSALSPTPTVLAQLDSLRLRHLEHVRAIHQTMREVDSDVFTVRSCTSLMSAYNHGRSWVEMEELWTKMRSSGGVGIDQRSVAVYFDACGFSGSLPQALSTWRHLKSSSFHLETNNYHSYIECLTRCGAWEDELIPFLSSQQTSHLLDPTTTPPVHPGSLAATLMLADRLVKNPHHQSLRQVDRKSYELLRRRMQELAGRYVWEEVQRLLGSRERFLEVGKKKQSLMRDRRERTELHRL